MNRITFFFSKWTIPLLLLFSVWAFSNLKWGEQWKYTITSDGKGYYAYLPALFIYDDLNLGFYDSIEANYYDSHTKSDYRSNAHGKVIDKYFCGVALLQAPFFLAGHAAAKISGAPADGYSKPYVIFFCLGAVFYLALGLVYFRRFLRMHGASGGLDAFLIAIVYFGTNLFYYTVVEPSMSHLYSFALVSVFLVYSKKWLETGTKKYAMLTALVLGVLTLVRPVNLLIIGWLFVEAGGIRPVLQQKLSLIKTPKTFLLCLVLFLLPVSLQFILYYFQTGHFFVDAYGNEGFHFLHPEIVNFLFSYKKGLFVYLPLTFVSLSGFYFYWKKDRTRALYAILFLAGIIYVLSCWWMWYYGGSFGTRVIVEYLPIFGLLLWYLLNGIKLKAVKISVITILVALALFCQFQTFQYRYELIHWSEMTKESYWNVFGVWPKK